MHLRDEILKEHSKKQAQKVSRLAVSSKVLFNRYIRLLISGEPVVAQRAAWSLQDICREKPEWILPQLPSLLECLKTSDHDAVKRNIVGMLQHFPIPEHLQGETTEICFGFLSDPKTAIAIRAFSMTVLLQITTQHPDLKRELCLVIESAMQEGIPALIARGKSTLKALNKF